MSENPCSASVAFSAQPFMCTSASIPERGHIAVNTLAVGSGSVIPAVLLAIGERIRANGRTSATMQAVTRRSPAGQLSTSTCVPMTPPGNLILKRNCLNFFPLILRLGLIRIGI